MQTRLRPASLDIILCWISKQEEKVHLGEQRGPTEEYMHKSLEDEAYSDSRTEHLSLSLSSGRLRRCGKAASNNALIADNRAR